MKERLLEFLRAENKTSAQLAEEIGVQPSGISHIMSGRNNPSLDFVLKMLEKYSFLSTEWLLFGKGIMYKDSRMQTLFNEISTSVNNNDLAAARKETVNQETDLDYSEITDSERIEPGRVPGKASNLSRIVWFYEDNTFVEYFPSK